MVARKDYQKGITIKLTQRRTVFILRERMFSDLGVDRLRTVIIPYLTSELPRKST